MIADKILFTFDKLDISSIIGTAMLKNIFLDNFFSHNL